MPACRYPYGGEWISQTACILVMEIKLISVYVSFVGSENAHEGRYDILPFTHEMEWVQARNGEVSVA